MTKIAMIAAALAVTATAVSPAFAAMPQGHQPGAPVRQGSYCWQYTSSLGHGFWTPCSGYRASVALADGDGNGGGGGGGDSDADR